MAIQGLRATTSVDRGESPENWREGIMLLEPNGSAPLYGLTSMMRGGGVTDDPRFHWFQEEHENYRVVMSAEITDAQTTIPVAEGAAFFKEGDVLMVESTREQLYVNADPTSDEALTVQRGWAGSPASAYNPGAAGNNPNVLLIGNAYEEGSLAPEGRTYSPEERENFTQIFRDTMEITGTAENTNLRTGDAVKEDRRRCLTKHSTSIERAMWFGRKGQIVKNGKPLRTMDGIEPQILPERTFTPQGAGLTLSEMEEWLMEIFRFGSGERMAFAGNRFLLGMNQAVRLNSDYGVEKGVREYGMNVTRFTTPFGTLVVKTHPQFNQNVGGTTSGGAYVGMDSWAFILDMANVKYRFMKGRDTKWQKNLEAVGQDAMKAGYLTECSIQVSHAKTHGLIKGVTGGMKDA